LAGSFIKNENWKIIRTA